MKTSVKRLAGSPQQSPGATGIPFASDTGIFLLLALSVIAAITSVLSQGLLGMDDDILGMLTHGLVILNGGEIEYQRAYL